MRFEPLKDSSYATYKAFWITNLLTSVKSSGFADNQKAQVIVTWDTDELTTSQVEYATGIEGTEYQNRTKEETALVTSHVVVISILASLQRSLGWITKLFK